MSRKDRESFHHSRVNCDNYCTKSSCPCDCHKMIAARREADPMSDRTPPDQNEWEFGDHGECPVCGTDCRMMFDEYPKLRAEVSSLESRLQAVTEALRKYGESLESRRISLMNSMKRADAAGRYGVANCRQSDVETIEWCQRELGALAEPSKETK